MPRRATGIYIRISVLSLLLALGLRISSRPFPHLSPGLSIHSLPFLEWFRPAQPYHQIICSTSVATPALRAILVQPEMGHESANQYTRRTAAAVHARGDQGHGPTARLRDVPR